MRESHIFPFLWMRGEPEEILRREIRAIYDCGIRAVCVEARPHRDFCGPGWWHDMDILLDEAEQRGMRVWILDDKHFPTGYANGLIESTYPERKKQYLNYSSADVFGAQRPIELQIRNMLRPADKLFALGKPVNEEERSRNSLVSVTALRFAEQNLFTEERIDLTASVSEGVLGCTLPSGAWKIVVVYHTCTDGGDESYINLIDEASAHTQIEGVYEAHFRRYGDKFGKTIAGFFSDEPQFGNCGTMEAEAIVGKTEMPMPWSDELEAMLLDRWGEKLYAMLPYLWHSTAQMADCPRFRYDYMDCVSLLYEKNFSNAIGSWCRAHGVEYIGHVVEDGGAHARLGMGAAHWFRAMSGQDMAGIDCIGGQVVYGAPLEQRTDVVSIDGEFCHYTLGKLGASAAHLDPKKQGRCMCELFGAYGWEFGVRDQKYVLDHLLSRGVNYLVPHAFSMVEYPDPDCPPHFYARGNHPEYPWFQALMRYAEEMCSRFSDGRYPAEVAVLYDAEAEWAGERMPMQAVARVLQTHQIPFDFISIDMLSRQSARYRTVWRTGALQIHGQTFRALVIPYMERISEALCQVLEAHPDFPVFFVNALPKAVVNPAKEAQQRSPAERLPKVKTVSLRLLPRKLVPLNLRRIRVEPAFEQLSVYPYEKDGKCSWFLLNESAEAAFSGKLYLPLCGPLVLSDPFAGTLQRLNPEANADGCRFFLTLAPGASCLIETADPKDPAVSGLPQYRRPGIGHTVADLSEGWALSCARAIDYPTLESCGVAEVLTPFSDIHPCFSGIIRYEKEFALDEVTGTETLVCEQVFEVMRVFVNGQSAGLVIRQPYRLLLGPFLQPGENRIVIEVATTPQREQQSFPPPRFILKHAPMEPTGLFGSVTLIR